MARTTPTEELLPGPRDCQINSTEDANTALDFAIAMVRTVGIALAHKGDLDDKAIDAAQLTISAALDRLDVVSGWVLDAYNDMVRARNDIAMRKGIVRLRAPVAEAAE
ncbi:hypothetical protein EV667_0231 [Ancylobacter aquaticus]|uniref:Uncharacterized protein n=1 Tax=Ancylobacter aquaticus TaxID=100 RepID=A0A4R1I4B8_ANCAQ|nr:hypothetical protein [Ancylobacter aquaticus]TCK30144.1 hypothetical protein EV667_0231 [Ancylobacter aquaticus]